MLLKPTKLIKYSLMSFIIGASVVVYNQEKVWAGYGAISYSPSQKTNGISNNKTSKDSAVKEARNNCGNDTSCKTTWVKDGCLALAVDLSNPQNYNWGSGFSLISAENNAQKNCQGSECTIIRSLCTE